MLLPLNSFTVLVEQMAAAVQGGASQLVDVSVGSVLRAVIEAGASLALWMQWLILQVVSLTRASTSNGADLDSWMADFSLTRLPGAAAAGTVTFARYTVGLNTVVPVGTIVRTDYGSQSFIVVASSSDAAWNGLNGYDLPAALASIDVPVQAVVTGSLGNVVSNAIGLLSTAIPGVDTVGNANALIGGVNPESDSALRTRFQSYINSRSLATRLAIGNAIVSVRQGLRFGLSENVDVSGAPYPGHFIVTVDDGTGFPSDDLVSDVQEAVEQVRPLGSTYAVMAPVVATAAVQMALETNDAAKKATVAALVQQSIVSWVEELPMGGTLAISKLDALAHMADPSVVSVVDTTINGAAFDIVAPANGVIIAGAVVVN